MPFVSSKHKPLFIHAAIWLGFAFYEQATLLITRALSFSIAFIALNYLLNAALFYLNSLFLLPKLYNRQHYGFYVAAAAGSLALYAVLRSELVRHTAPLTPATGLPGASAYSSLWFASVYRGSFFLFVSIGYWFARNAIALEVQKRQQQERLRLMEHNLLEANLLFLRNQINPHFLFNSLNFLYAQVYQYSESAARGVLLLSEMMRYALHEDGRDKVMLGQEVKHLRNYIELNQLRFNNTLQVTFEVVGSTNFFLILPLILITFVENCFKHGELFLADEPLLIRLTLVQNQLTFLTRNRKRDGPKEKSTGIGLDNTRKRLELIYPSRYSLTVTDEPTHFTCILHLEL